MVIFIIIPESTLESFLIFWKPTKGHNSNSYGPITPILVYTIHPVIVHVYTNFQLS